MKKPKFSNGAYNSLLETLDRNINIVKSISTETLANENSKWVETSRKVINVKKSIDLFKKPRTYMDDNRYREYKYEGNLCFKNKGVRNIRKLLEIEPRLLKEIYESAEIMFNSLKLAEIRSFKYEKLFRLTSENNEYNKSLLKLEKEDQELEEEWNELHEYGSYPNDDYCPFYSDYSEQEQIQLDLKHKIKSKTISNTIVDVKDSIIDNEVEISKIFNGDITEKNIANSYEK